MSKDDMQIMVVANSVLFPDNIKFEGFRNHGDGFDLQSLLLEHHFHMRRGDAEVDFAHKQPIPYGLIVNPEKKLVFGFLRASNKGDYHETRLHGKWSLGVGGHLEQIDSGEENPIHAGMLRELEEEVEIVGASYVRPRILGYINSESDEVSQVHLGVVYLIETDATEINPRDPEVARAELMTLEKLEEFIASPEYVVEPWAQIAYGTVKEYFENL